MSQFPPLVGSLMSTVLCSGLEFLLQPNLPIVIIIIIFFFFFVIDTNISTS
jgi:hypothetical protein